MKPTGDNGTLWVKLGKTVCLPSQSPPQTQQPLSSLKAVADYVNAPPPYPLGPHHSGHAVSPYSLPRLLLESCLWLQKRSQPPGATGRVCWRVLCPQGALLNQCQSKLEELCHIWEMTTVRNVLFIVSQVSAVGLSPSGPQKRPGHYTHFSASLLYSTAGLSHSK